MFRHLLPALADRYRVVAPDYPGFGYSAFPSADQFDYSFENYARLWTASPRRSDSTAMCSTFTTTAAPSGCALRCSILSG